MSTRSNPNSLRAYWLTLAFALSLTVIYVFQGYYPHIMTVLSNALPILISGTTVVASSFALRSYWHNLESKLSRIWLGFTLGTTFWFLSELSRTVYALAFNINAPYPSVADVYRLVGYGFLFFAISTYISLFRPVITKKTATTALFLVLPTSASTIPSLLLSVTARAATWNLSTFLVYAGYPLLDLCLLSQAILGLLAFTKTKLSGKLGLVWVLVNAGIIMNVFGDLLFSYTNLQNTYYSGHPLELFFFSGYLFFLLSFYIHMKSL